NERESKNETHAKNLRGTNNSADAQAMPAEHGKRYEKGDSPGERPGQLARGPAPAGLYGPSSRTACAANDASIACSIFKGRRVKPKSRNVAKSWRIELTLRRPFGSVPYGTLARMTPGSLIGVASVRIFTTASALGPTNLPPASASL